MSHKMNNIVKLGKDRTEKWNETSVIYKFNCDKCSSVYVGETKRCLKTRINEHKKSVIDGLKLEDCQKLLPVPQHIKDTHNFDWAKTLIR